jgi:membrane fusion protein (multidrug efflux system)
VKVGARLADGSIDPDDGAIDFLGVEVDPTTDSLTVRAQVPNPQGYLVDGQLVTTIAKPDKPELVPVVPYEAMQIDQSGRYVLTLDTENKVKVQRIETGQTYGNNIIITQGLNEGDRVITIGVQKVRPDMVVDPTEASLEASPS